jgi:Tol biopolymer transport system component
MTRWALLVAGPVALAAWVAVQTLSPTKLVLIGPDGTRTVLGDVPGDTFSPRLSPDGQHVSFQSRGAAWVADIHDLTSRHQFKPASNVTFPVWRDATRLVFISMQDRPSLYSAAMDADRADLLVDVARAPDGWSDANDGASFITLEGDDYDIWFYSATTKRVTPLVVIQGSRQLSSQISPDGKWVAYKSDETGAFEIWVQPFPSGPRVRVTRNGGRNPRWSADGRELFFDDDRQIFAMMVTSENPLTFSAARALLVTGFVQAGSLRRQWDVAADGRFLIIVR